MSNKRVYYKGYRSSTRRIQNYNYSNAGYYHIIFITKGWKWTLGKIKNNTFLPYEQGKIAERILMESVDAYPRVILDEYQFMPNHLHMIVLVLPEDGSEEHCFSGVVPTIHESSVQKPLGTRVQPVVQTYDDWLASRQPGTVQQVKRSMLIYKFIGRFSMLSTKHINLYQGTKGQHFWVRRPYEHIIRNEKSLDKIRDYIRNNPWNWKNDSKFNIETLKKLWGQK